MTKKSGLMIDETRKLKANQRKRIAKTLQLLNGVDPATILDKIESATQDLWAEIDEEQKRQGQSQIARELRQVVECAGALRAAINSLGGDADAELGSRFLSKQSGDTSYLTFEHLYSKIKRLSDAALSFKPGGRPREDAMGHYIERLAHIREDSTGVWPMSKYNPYDPNEQIPFFAECISAAGVPYPTGIINQVLKMGAKLRKAR